MSDNYEYLIEIDFLNLTGFINQFINHIETLFGNFFNEIVMKKRNDYQEMCK